MTLLLNNIDQYYYDIYEDVYMRLKRKKKKKIILQSTLKIILLILILNVDQIKKNFAFGAVEMERIIKKSKETRVKYRGRHVGGNYSDIY